VTYESSLLTVKAHNSSLNQILRAIMRETGLQITGGVTDERVYGVYGPASVPTLLASLLDGTDTNILYIPANADRAAQLILTSRDGSSAPPPPGVTASDDLLPDGPEDDSSPQLAAQPNAGQPNAGPSNGSTGSAAANTVPAPRTMDEIYQQLLQIHAAQQQAAPAPAAPAVPN
jgi:hypothetical protein